MHDTPFERSGPIAARPAAPLPDGSQPDGLQADAPLADVFAADCPSRQVLRCLASRWGVIVIVALCEQVEPQRFSALKRRIGGISERMLAQTLQDLESCGIVARTQHPVVPPHVDYALTPLGREASERMAALTGWVEANLPRLMPA